MDAHTALWPDDPDAGHPFTKAALDGDVGVVMEHVARQTFDPNSKKAQHALLVACRMGEDEFDLLIIYQVLLTRLKKGFLFFLVSPKFIKILLSGNYQYVQ